MKWKTEEEKSKLTASIQVPAGICVSVAGENVAQAIDIARQSERYADVIEIRLDTLADPGISLFMKEFHVPLLFTNRPDWEGGFFKGSEARRIELLAQAVQHDCALVDLELKTAPELRGELLDILLQHPKTGLIISWHDFFGTPDSEELGEILQQQMESGAHIGKIVTTANDYSDILRVLNLQAIAAQNNFPLIAFCMGAIGKISRLATTKLGGYMTYAAPDGGKETAPGQIPVSVIRDMLARLDHAD
ncbi:MAG: type I 3-dehydroquinate dehydratase [Deltaproteobacteria bacterium]|jgi:3-dehydroquinate dehydratase-1/3-dehydroquinate dehydratase/shikimate dehydrogenase|nr:type I 3-dehydroquinate dehydratase [Deltaproteobacteria bacterium]